MDPTMDPTALLNTDPDRAQESNAGRILGIVTTVHFLALAVVGLRTYARLHMVRVFRSEDGFIIASAACALGGWICLCWQISLGIGHHGDTISIVKRTEIEKIGFWETQLTDGLALGLLRISMALSLSRLARDAPWFKWSLRAVIGFVTAYTIQAILWLFFYCKPFSGWWEFQWLNPFDPRCADFNLFVNLTYWNICCNIFTDVCLGALPVPIILKLQMKRKVRFYVIAIMNLGYVAVLMGILKAVFMLIDGGSPDRTFNHWVQFWKNLQLNFGLIAACASFLKPLLGKLLRLGTSKNYKQSSDYYARQANGGPRHGLGSHNLTIGSQGRPGGGIMWHGDQDDIDIDIYQVGRSRTSALGSPRTMEHGSSREVKVEANSHSRQSSRHDVYRRPSPDTGSEELIIQKPPAGIVMTKEFTVTRGPEQLIYSARGT